MTARLKVEIEVISGRRHFGSESFFGSISTPGTADSICDRSPVLTDMRRIIDAHLDLAWNALSWKRDITLPLTEMNRRDRARLDHPARGRATTCLPEMRRGGVAVCLATLMARVPYGSVNSVFADTLDYPCHDAAYAAAQGQLAYYRQLEQRGQVAIIRTASDLDAHWARWEGAAAADLPHLPVGLVVSMEGCDAIVDPDQAEHWREAGLRCASLVHYGRSAYAAGTGEVGPLTPSGQEMLKQFARLGIILDVTHLSDASFFEALDVYEGPLLASHQNCRKLVSGDRQFSDQQIQAVIERGGILGAAADAWMLDENWPRGNAPQFSAARNKVSLEAIANHIDRVCQLAGNSLHAALGSDLDGGFGSEQTPRDLESIADLQKIAPILSRRGYGDSALDAIFNGNWLRFFRRYLPE